jgi:NAD(P)-dependent dehydrogenase (short-subunit alcohol dehydrogenase family)
MKLDKRVALIVGGASGLGRASAEACGAEGAHVVIADLNLAAAQAVAAELNAGPGTASAVRVDAADEESVRRAIEQTVETQRRLDILVNPGNDRHQRTLWLAEAPSWPRVIRCSMTPRHRQRRGMPCV